MKTILALLMCVSVCAGTVTFVWENPNPPAMQVTYRIYDMPDGTNAVRLVDTPNLTAAEPFAPGLHKVFVTAVSTNGIESEASNTVEFWVPTAPTNIAIVIAR